MARHPWTSRRRLAWSATILLAAGAAVEALTESPTARLSGLGGAATGVALALLATLPLLGIARWPRGAPLLAAAAFVSTVPLGFSANLAALAMVIAPGACAFRAGWRTALPAALAGFAAIVIAPAIAGGGITLTQAVINGVAIVLATLVGAGARDREHYARELEARTRELEALLHVETRAAVAQERLRIARDVHDAVGHALAAIALHARVAERRLSRDPDGAARSLAEVADLATAALAETRDAVGPMRTDAVPADLRPQPSLDDLDELVGRLRSSGLSVEVRRDLDGPPIPGVVQAAAFRIVQESLSNVVHHASRAPATVALRRRASALEIEVLDRGTGTAGPRAGGLGVLGMRERAIGLGGSLDAGPCVDGGWRVTATLPIAEARP